MRQSWLMQVRKFRQQAPAAHLLEQGYPSMPLKFNIK
jgi:hypothetical protein